MAALLRRLCGPFTSAAGSLECAAMQTAWRRQGARVLRQQAYTVQRTALNGRPLVATPAASAPYTLHRCGATAPSRAPVPNRVAIEESFLAIVRPTRVHDVVNPRLLVDVTEEPAWVSDAALILSDPERRRLNELCEQVHNTWRVEVAVVLLDSLPENIQPAGFAAALLNYWGVGDKRLHTGIVAVLLHGQRRLEVRVGYGVGRVLTPAKLQTMQQERMLPHLKQGQPGIALEEMVLSFQKELTADGPPHWRRATGREADLEPNKQGFGGGQTPVDEFLPPSDSRTAESTRGSTAVPARPR